MTCAVGVDLGSAVHLPVTVAGKLLNVDIFRADKTIQRSLEIKEKVS